LVLMGLNIGLVASTIFFLWAIHSVPGILALSCGAIGGVTVYSRVKIWKSGVLRALYAVVENNEDAVKKLRAFDSLFWIVGISNSGVCLWYGINGYVIK
jgi:hypothetical protein